MDLASNPSNYTLPALPHLSRAEGVVFYLMVMLFNYLHPKYAAYIEALETRQRLLQMIHRTECVQNYWYRGHGYNFKAHQCHTKTLQPFPPSALPGEVASRRQADGRRGPLTPHLKTALDNTLTTPPQTRMRGPPPPPKNEEEKGSPARGRTCC